MIPNQPQEHLKTLCSGGEIAYCCSAPSDVFKACVQERSLSRQQVGVRAPDEVFRRVVVAELCEADLDRAPGGISRESFGHVRKALANPPDVDVRQCTDELIATKAHDQVIGAQTRPKGVGDGDEQGISGEVTFGVVDQLQTVDIDERDHQLFRGTTRTIYLPLKLLHPGTPPPDVGQFICVRGFAVERSLGTIARRQGTVMGGLCAFFGGPGAIGRRPGTIIGRPLTIAGCPECMLLSSHRPRRVARGAHSRGAGVPRLGYLAAPGRHLSTLVCRDVSRDSGSQTSARLLFSEIRGVLAVRTGSVTSPLISALGGLLIAGDLVLV